MGYLFDELGWCDLLHFPLFEPLQINQSHSCWEKIPSSRLLLWVYVHTYVKLFGSCDLWIFSIVGALLYSFMIIYKPCGVKTNLEMGAEHAKELINRFKPLALHPANPSISRIEDVRRHFWLRVRNSIRGCIRLSIRPSVVTLFLGGQK